MCGVRGWSPSVAQGVLRGIARRRDSAGTERSTESRRPGSDRCAVRDRVRTVRLLGSRRGGRQVRGQAPTRGHTGYMRQSGRRSCRERTRRQSRVTVAFYALERRTRIRSQCSQPDRVVTERPQNGVTVLVWVEMCYVVDSMVNYCLRCLRRGRPSRRQRVCHHRQRVRIVIQYGLNNGILVSR